MQFTAGQIAEFLQGEVDGDAQVLVNDVAKIEQGRSGTLAFLANPRYIDHLYTTAASVVLVERAFQPTRSLPKSLTLIRVDDPRAAFGRLLEMHERRHTERTGWEQPSFVAPTVKYGKDIYIGMFSTVADGAVLGDGVKIFPGCHVGEGVTIGAGSILHPGVRIYRGSVLGARCIIHSGTVIGADGFGYTPTAEGRNEKIAQIGNVVIGDDVEIGANCTIDRATLGSTVIAEGVKMDNLVQVGHNVEIGAHTIIVAQTGIAGSTRIGRQCLIGGQVGIAGHLTIGDRVRIAAQSGIGKDLPDGSVVQGSPAFALNDYKRSHIVFRELPELRRELARLRQRIAQLASDTLNP